jgi:phosphoenolpyruvate-protein kinase (PTS system EI component)
MRIGAMIEVPSAIFTIEEILNEVDFLCLGTNDLVQYLLAVDRDNEMVADWFRTLHPSVLRAVKTVLQTAEKKAIPVIVCGEMAGSPAYVPVLLGLGATEMSMNVNSMARVRKIISEIALEETRELVKILEDCRTADEVEYAAANFYQEKWSHLFPKDVFPPKKKYKI